MNTSVDFKRFLVSLIIVTCELNFFDSHSGHFNLITTVVGMLVHHYTANSENVKLK